MEIARTAQQAPSRPPLRPATDFFAAIRSVIFILANHVPQADFRDPFSRPIFLDVSQRSRVTDFSASSNSVAGTIVCFPFFGLRPLERKKNRNARRPPVEGDVDLAADQSIPTAETPGKRPRHYSSTIHFIETEAPYPATEGRQATPGAALRGARRQG